MPHSGSSGVGARDTLLSAVASDVCSFNSWSAMRCVMLRLQMKMITERGRYPFHVEGEVHIGSGLSPHYETANDAAFERGGDSNSARVTARHASEHCPTRTLRTLKQETP